MGFSGGLRAWSDLDDAIVASVRTFGSEHGSRPDAKLDADWWTATLARKPSPSMPSGISGHYDTSDSYALQDLIDDTLGLSRWKGRPKGAVQWLMWPPFTFAGGWTRRETANLAIVVGDPNTLLATTTRRTRLETKMRALFAAGWKHRLPVLVYW